MWFDIGKYFGREQNTNLDDDEQNFFSQIEIGFWEWMQLGHKQDILLWVALQILVIVKLVNIVIEWICIYIL